MNDIFYQHGLKFECQKCSKCCRFDPGFVYLNEYDIERICGKLILSREEFLRKFCKGVGFNGSIKYSLIEKSNYDCIFWNNEGCQIYEARPMQCRTYPFWKKHLDSKEIWDNLEKNCPGINKGRIYNRKEIDDLLNLQYKENV